DQIWEELHHQGDVGEASYAVIPYIVAHARRVTSLQAEVVAFVYVVEQCRQAGRNPEVPQEISEAYFEALEELPRIVLGMAKEGWSED
ncbi:hypothetical protein ABTC53_19915, partial [Acinetobacter baumannii]